MDFSKNDETSKVFEQALGQNGDMLSVLLPLLSGEGLGQEAIFKILAQNNPRLDGIMKLMPLLTKAKVSSVTELKPKTQYVKISDYYKNN